MKLEDLADDMCMFCGTPLPEVRKMTMIYCNRRCRQKHYDQLDHEARLEARTGLICQECGQWFVGVGRGQRYCSYPCRRRAVRRRLYGERACEHCGKPYVANYAPQRACGAACAGRMRAQAGCSPGVPPKQNPA